MKLLSKILLVLYLLTLVWVILFKFSLDLSSLSGAQTGLNLVPFSGGSQANLGETIANFVIFIPLGLLLGVNFKQTSFWRKLAFIFAFSTVVEIIQFVFSIGIADITDVITNGYGGFLGLLLYSLISKRVHSRKLDRFIVLIGTALLLLLLGILFSGGVRFKLPPADVRVEPQTILNKDVQLVWPAVGQAAVGSVKDGLIARSSDDQDSRPMASMAKVITALAIMEKQPFELGQSGQSYTLTSEDVAIYQEYVIKDGSVLPVYEGMVLTQYQAMQMMLIASSNNMADTLVEKEFGSMEAYISYTEDMLERMGLSQTVVADASGFSSDTASTPSELVLIGIAALKNPVIAEIVGQSQAWIPGIGAIANTNELLGVDGVVGIKTGTTDEAGSCLLFAANYTDGSGESVTIVGAIMGDANAERLFSDSNKLLASVQQSLGLSKSGSSGSTNDAAVPPPTFQNRAPRQ